MTRLASDPTTKTYVAKRRAEGKTTKEIIRCLKRYIAREVFGLLTKDRHVPDPSDLRPARHTAGLTLQTVADHFGVWPAHISEIERGVRRDDKLEQAYRNWLTLQVA